jgi:hypothetical protein
MPEITLTIANLADWFDLRAEREREISRALRDTAHWTAGEIAAAKAGVWDEAAAAVRETVRRSAHARSASACSWGRMSGSLVMPSRGDE